MKKILYIIFTCLLCSSCSLDWDSLKRHYEEVEIAINEKFINGFEKRLHKGGIKDLEASIRGLEYDYDEYGYINYNFDLIINSKDIDQYKKAGQSEKKAKELYNVLEKTYIRYKEYAFSSFTFSVDDIEEEICVTFFDHCGTLRIYGEQNEYAYHDAQSDYKYITINDKKIYEKVIKNTNKVPSGSSSSKNDKAYMEGYYDALENWEYDYERYYTDDYYRMGVDDALLEQGYEY